MGKKHRIDQIISSLWRPLLDGIRCFPESTLWQMLQSCALLNWKYFRFRCSCTPVPVNLNFVAISPTVRYGCGYFFKLLMFSTVKQVALRKKLISWTASTVTRSYHSLAFSQLSVNWSTMVGCSGGPDDIMRQRRVRVGWIILQRSWHYPILEIS